MGQYIILYRTQRKVDTKQREMFRIIYHKLAL